VELTLQSEKVYLEVRRSRRSSRIRLKYRQGRIELVLPDSSQKDPKTVVEENQAWILEKWREAKEFREQVPSRVFEEGEKFSIMSNDKELVVERRRSNKVEQDRIVLASHLVNRTGLKDQLEKALREHFRTIISEKLEVYECQVEGSYGKVFIRDQNTRWGSCSSQNNLNFNWRLVLGPEHVIDYIAVHELVHLDIPDHSQSFWQKVEELKPDFRKSQNWLRNNSAKLVFDPQKKF